MKKKNSKLSGFYLGLIFVLMYLPIAVVIVFSFNESKLPVRFTGFSLKWYQADRTAGGSLSYSSPCHVPVIRGLKIQHKNS